MPLIVTPRQLAHRSEFYHQLASLISAGVGLLSALETLFNSPPARSYRAPLSTLIEQLRGGASLAEASTTLPRTWFPLFDRALIEAGENSGRLDVCFRYLTEYYQERARLARQVLSDLAYPAFVLHMAVLIFPTGLLTRLVWQGEIVPFVLAKVAIFGPLYVSVVAFLYWGQSGRGERWRSALELVLRRVPVVGIARANLALARLSVALESLLNAGVSIIQAWELAAAASGSPALQRTVLAWRSDVLNGQTPAEAVRASHAFPELFTNLYSTGEISGQLDDTLRRLYQYYQEEAQRQFRLLAEWLPRLIYLVVVFFIAYQIISFWGNYFSQIGNAIS
jgi:type II secretory pathway component PulF